MLPILNDPDYIPPPPQLNNTAAAPVNNDTHLNNVLSDATRLLLSSDNLDTAADESSHDTSDSSVVLSALKFYSGRKRSSGQLQLAQQTCKFLYQIETTQMVDFSS